MHRENWALSIWLLAQDCFITIICAHCADLIRRCLNTSWRILARRPIQHCCLQSHLLQYTDLILPVYWQSSQLLSMSHFSRRSTFERIIVMKKVYQFVSKSISQRLSRTSGVVRVLIKSTVFYTATKIPLMYSFSGNSASSAPISTFMCLWVIYIVLGSVYIFPPAE